MNDNIDLIVRKCIENKVAKLSSSDKTFDKKIIANKKSLCRLSRLCRFLRKLRKKQEIRRHYRNIYLKKLKKRRRVVREQLPFFEEIKVIFQKIVTAVIFGPELIK